MANEKTINPYLNILYNFLVTGLALFLFQTYCSNKLAIQRQKDELYMAEKKQAYFESIDIAWRVIADQDYDINQSANKLLPTLKRNKGTTSPSEIEINKTYAKLYIYAADTVILHHFSNLVMTSKRPYSPGRDMKSLLNAIGKDLGYTPNEIKKSYELLYILTDTSNRKTNP